MPSERAALFRNNADVHGITLSIHGPYYISLGTPDRKLIENSLGELQKSVTLAEQLDAVGVVFHPGRIGGETRAHSLAVAIDALREFDRTNGVGQAHLFPEVAGKIVNLGSLDEILEICRQVESCWPCLDLAHYHARTLGTLQNEADFHQVLDRVEGQIGRTGLEKCHFHFCPIEWGTKGEIRHRAFGELVEQPPQLDMFPDGSPVGCSYLPRYEPFLAALSERELAPIIICEARDTQDTGALEMKEHWRALSEASAGEASPTLRHRVPS